MHSYEAEERRMSPPQIAAMTAVGVSLLVFALKFLLWRSSHSAAVGAAAWHVVAGLLYALLMLGILKSPEDKPVEEDLSEAEREYLQYQAGLQVNVKRHEAVLALAGSLGLLAVAYLIFRQVLNAREIVSANLTAGVFGLLLAYFAMHFLARFTERIGYEHETPGLVATSFHARTDAFASLLAALALVTVAMGFHVERLFAALIGLLLVADAAQLFVDATRRLVGLEDDSPTAQLPFWVRLRDALRQYAEAMPPIIRWLLRYEDAMSPAELRQSRRVALVVVLVVYLATGFKTVQLGEIGAVKVFGQYHHKADAGPVYALWPFVSVRIVPVDRLQRVTIGFTSAREWQPHQENRPFGEMLWANHDQQRQLFTIDPVEAKFMLGDTTQVETHVAVTYTVDLAKVDNYLFDIENPQQVVQRMARQAVQELMLTRRLDEVLLENRAELEAQAEDRLQTSLDRLDCGIQVNKIMIRSIHPPVEVLDSFVDVASAQEDKQATIIEAEGYRTRNQLNAEGDAIRLLNAAEGERLTRISGARGQTAAYRQVAAAAQAAPDAVRARLAIESWERLLSGKKLVLVPRGAGQTRTKIWFSGTAASNPAGANPSEPATVPAGGADEAAAKPEGEAAEKTE